MRILYIVTRSEMGGAQVHLLDLIAGLPRQHEAVIAVGDRGYLTDEAEKAGISYHVIPNLVHPMRPLTDLRGLRSIASLVRRIKPDLIHAHTSKAGVIGRLASKLTGVPAVFTAHTWCFAEGTSWKWRTIGIPVERYVSRLGGRIITVSESNRKLALAQKVGNVSTITTVHNGIPDTEHRSNPGSGDGPVRVIMVARFAPQKDQALLLRTIAERKLAVTVSFIGDGDSRPAVESLARDLGIQSQVEFLGNRKDIPAQLAQAHIFALPTNWEGFPLSILEAMRAGLPVIASDVGGCSESIVHGHTGYLVPSGDSDSLGDYLSLLVQDASLRDQLGRAGRQRFEEHFTVEAMLTKTLSVYTAALSGDRKDTFLPRELTVP